MSGREIWVAGLGFELLPCLITLKLRTKIGLFSINGKIDFFSINSIKIRIVQYQ